MEISSQYNSYQPIQNQPKVDTTESTNKASEAKKTEETKEKTQNIETKQDDNKQEVIAKTLQTYQASGTVSSTNFPSQPTKEFIA